jgi:hypothetical protein
LLILAAPMSGEGHLSDKIIIIMCIICIIVKEQNLVSSHFNWQYLFLPSGIEPRSTAALDAVLTARPWFL